MNKQLDNEESFSDNLKMIETIISSSDTSDNKFLKIQEYKKEAERNIYKVSCQLYNNEKHVNPDNQKSLDYFLRIGLVSS
jgi:hypothetical protein